MSQIRLKLSTDSDCIWFSQAIRHIYICIYIYADIAFDQLPS